MIRYEPLLKTLSKRKVDIYWLQEQLNNYTLRGILNANRYISTETIDKICCLLKCDVKDVIRYEDGDQTIGDIQKKQYTSLDYVRIKYICKQHKSSFPKLSLAIGFQRTYMNTMSRYKKIGVVQARNILKAINSLYGLELTMKDIEAEDCPF